MVESTLNSTFNSNDAAAYLTEKSPKESKLTTFDKTGISSSQFSQGETLKDKIDQVGETVGDIMRGDIPSNQEISQFLDNMQRSLGRQQNLDTQGKRLASDLQYILKNTKSLLRTLNSDDTFQRFAKETAEFTKDLSETGEYAAKKLEKDSYNALGEAKELVYNVKEFLMYILRSGEFRRLMDDFTQLFSNISGNFERRHKKNLKQSVKSDVNREDTNASSTKQALKEVKDDVQKGKLVNQQDKDRIVERLNILFDKLFNNKEYNRAAQNLFNIMDIFSRRMDQLKKDPNMQLQDNEHFEQMMQDAEYIICKLVGKENWKSFTGEFWNLYSDIRNDKEANKFFTDLRSFLDDSIKNPEKFKEESERQKVQKFVDRAYALMERGERKYSDRFNELYDYLYDMYDNAAEQTSDLTDSVNKFARDMFTDNQGRPDIYVTQQSLIQLKNMMVPMIQEGLANIPLPRFESSDEYYNLWLDNIVLDGRGILPERFEFKAFTDIVLDVNSPVNKATTQIWTKIDKIDMDFKTVHFYYLRKSFPSIEDYGIADVTIRGMKLGLVWTIASKTDWPLRMKLKEVICTMDKFDIDVLQSKHRLLDEIGTTFFTGWIKREILNLMKEKVKAIFAPFVEELNNYFIEQKRSIDKNWSSESFMKNANAKLHEMTSSSQEPLKDKISRKGQEFKHEAKEKYEETKKTAQQKFHQFNQWFDEKMDWSKNFE